MSNDPSNPTMNPAVAQAASATPGQASERLLDLQRRIAQASEADDQEVSLEEEKYLTFRLDGRIFGTKILSILEIIRPITITRLPNSPKYVLGVINLRGVIVPVVDLHERFSFGRAEVSRKNRIIIVETGKKNIGLLVDEVNNVVGASRDKIEPASRELAGVSVQFFDGYFRLNNEIILLLELGEIL